MMTEQEYRANPRISPSDIRSWENNPNFWYESLVDNGYKEEPSDSMLLGTYLHECVLGTPHTVKAVYRVTMPFPDSTMAKKENKEWFEAIQRESEVPVILLPDITLEQMAKLNFNRFTEKLRENKFPELTSISIENPLFNNELYIKGRPDYVAESLIAEDSQMKLKIRVVDYKTSAVGLGNVAKTINSYNYWRQLLMYAYLVLYKEKVSPDIHVEIELYVFFQQTTEPYRCQPVRKRVTVDYLNNYMGELEITKIAPMIKYVNDRIEGRVDNIIDFDNLAPEPFVEPEDYDF